MNVRKLEFGERQNRSEVNRVKRTLQVNANVYNAANKNYQNKVSNFQAIKQQLAACKKEPERLANTLPTIKMYTAKLMGEAKQLQVLKKDLVTKKDVYLNSLSRYQRAKVKGDKLSQKIMQAKLEKEENIAEATIEEITSAKTALAFAESEMQATPEGHVLQDNQSTLSISAVSNSNGGAVAATTLSKYRGECFVDSISKQGNADNLQLSYITEDGGQIMLSVTSQNGKNLQVVLIPQLLSQRIRLWTDCSEIKWKMKQSGIDLSRLTVLGKKK